MMKKAVFVYLCISILLLTGCAHNPVDSVVVPIHHTSVDLNRSIEHISVPVGDFHLTGTGKLETTF